MPEEYSNTIGGAGATVKGRPLDEEGSRGWEEGGVSEKYGEAAASRQVRGRARHSSGRLQVSRKRLSYSDKEQGPVNYPGSSLASISSRMRPSASASTTQSAVPSTSPINEVTEDSEDQKAADHYQANPRIQERRQDAPTEYTSLLPHKSVTRNQGRFSTRSFSARTSILSNSRESTPCADDELSDEVSSNSSITSSMTGRQYAIFAMIMWSSLSSSFTVCLFPPFFPRLAEMKGATATDYGLIIGTNCLVAFIVTPFVGNHLDFIGVKFAFITGIFGGGACCLLSGFLEYFQPGTTFLLMSILVRIIHAMANAMVITSTFTYTACEFPTSVAKIFSITRCVMNVAQLGGPIVGGLLYEAGGFMFPFVVFGAMQMVLSLFAFCLMTSPEPDEEDIDIDADEQLSNKHRKKKNKVSVCAMLSIPTVWFSFAAFIIATACNGFLSINLEPQVLRNFNLTPFYIGIFFGLRDGANSLASPIWGWLCDRNKTSVKPFLVVSSLLVAISFFLMGASNTVGVDIKMTLPLLVAALCFNGAGIGGQQVVGVVDAMHEAAAAGHPDNPATHGLVAGLWSSLSGAGRFVSRGASGFLVDEFGFDAVSSIACGLQVVIAGATFLYITMCECRLVSRDSRLRSQSVTIVEQGRRRNEHVVFTTNSSPSESLMNHSVHVRIPNTCSGARMISRIANSMPPKKWNNHQDSTNQHRSRSIR